MSFVTAKYLTPAAVDVKFLAPELISRVTEPVKTVGIRFGEAEEKLTRVVTSCRKLGNREYEACFPDTCS
jgi:hypothetical protein